MGEQDTWSGADVPRNAAGAEQRAKIGDGEKPGHGKPETPPGATLSRDEQRLALWNAIRSIKFGSPTDDKVLLDSLHTLGFVISRWQAGAASPQAWAAAVRTLEALRYTYLDGAEMWKPPRGKRPAWLNFDGAVDEKALATAQDIALIWGLERSQFVSRIQVAVRDAMDWMRRSMPPAAPEPAATVSDAFERALAELVNKIDTGLDSGDLLQDAKRASAALDSILSGGDLVACAHEYFRDSGERYEKSIEFRIGWNACLDAIGQARAASTATATVDDLAMLVRKLVRHVRKARPDNNMADMAMDYLRRHGLEESPLRAAAPQAGALTDSQREAIEWAIGPATSFEYTHHVAALQSLLAEQSAAPRAPIAQFAIPEGFKVVKLDPRCDGCDKGVTTGQGICCHNGCFADEERQRGRESWKQIPGFSPLPRASEQADEALKADAERYRWLLAHPEHVEYGDFYDRTYLGPSATVSDAIDAARIKEPK